MDTQRKEIKAVVLGGEGTGKTALVKKYLRSVFEEVEEDYDPVWDGFERKQVSIEGQAYLLELFPAEPAGENFLCQTGEAFVLLYAINNRRSFQHIKHVHNQLRSTKGQALSRIPVFLVGTKADLESGRQISLEEGRQLAIELRCQKLFEISAKTHEAEISDLFEKLVRETITMANSTPSSVNVAPMASPPPRPPMTATSQSPSTTSIRQSQEASSPTTESPRRSSSVFDRLKFGSLKRKPSLQSLSRKKSGSFSNMMSRNQSRDQLQTSNDIAPPRNVRSVSAGNILNSTQSRPAAPPSRPSDTSISSPYKLDVDTSSWRDSIKWPTEIIPEEDSKPAR
ncbi:Ras subunit of RAS small GTPases [Knufia obscura]|uniref:small monomeric GTPase n=1 Tax=Knufia obscura TaxID=1635080 RepID=A0ABR0RCU2_9EURO|nr:Ras subunit of RAS small GTPases [Knufia obscura]